MSDAAAMSQGSRYQTTFVPITVAMTARMRELAPAATTRLRGFGLADRLESAWALLLSPLAPMLGWLLLGWSSDTVLACLLINLGIGLVDDLWKILRSDGGPDQLQRECLHDQFVWPIAIARALGRDAVYGKTLPTLHDLDAPISVNRQPVIVIPLLALLAAGAVLFILSLVPSSQASTGGVVAGTLPNLLLFAIANAVQATGRNPHWRRAGSVRIATVTTNALLLISVALISLAMLEREDFAGAAVLGSGLAIGLGAWRLHRRARLRLAATWLERVALRTARSTGAGA